MGVIYKATSPSGKSYVGQTKYTAEKRWKQHVNEANCKQFHQCRALNEAIKKYGGDNFILEILLECSNDELNDWEEEYIESENTLYPNGYNLTRGGHNTTVEYTEEIRQRISDAHRKFSHDDYDLPRYVRYINEDNKIGFRINIPGKKAYLITNSNLSIDEKYNITMDIYNKILNDEDDPNKNNKKRLPDSENLPMYISYIASREGYEVRKPDYTRKWFSSKKETKEQKYQKALEYLNSL